MLVSLFLFAVAESPHFSLLINPYFLHSALPVPSTAQEAYSGRHIDTVSEKAATGTRMTRIMSQRVQE